MNLQQIKKAFTLVELIVVITILAILGTIAFMAFQGYSKDARDSVRVADISNLKSSLELFQVNSGIYPEPTNGTNITYSGGIVWTQGTIGNSVVENLQKLNSKPLDPLSGDEYTYSRLNTKKEYELGAIIEGELTHNIIVPETYAATDNARAYIKGSYNGIVAKVSTGSTTYVLALPSIITTDIEETDLVNILTNKKLSYHNTKNIPGSYKGYASSGAIDYNSITPNNIVVYEGDIKILSKSGALQQIFVDKLQTAYNGSAGISNADIENIISQNTADTAGTEFLAQVLISETLDDNVVINTSSTTTQNQDTGGGSTGTIVTKISTGGYHTCAIVGTGSLQCWGAGSYGRLGDGGTTNRYTPVQAIGLETGVTDVSLGDAHTCAVKDGAAMCWGYNSYGALGNGSTTAETNPVVVTGLSSGVESIESGIGYTCALLTNGGVKCWGDGYFGQLGYSSTTDSFTPVSVTGLTSGVTKLAVGGYHACAILATGDVKCWGYDTYGQLGYSSSTANQSTPITITGAYGAIDISAGGYHTCAIFSGGGVKCWGYNNNSQIGDGTTTNRDTPVQVTGLTSGATKLITGTYVTCAIMDNQTVKCWGKNDVGQLGDGTTSNKTIPTDISGLSGVTNIDTWTNHTCVVLDTGVAKCWGDPSSGRLGGVDISDFTQNTPLSINGLESGVLGIDFGTNHACALFDTGGVKCWGYNGNGQVGDGTTETKFTPTQVTGLTSGVSKIFAGFNQSCAILNTGALQCWGYNSHGMIGDGTSSNNKLTPTQVSGLTSGVTDVGLGYNFTCGIHNGAAKCWGYNYYGIGDGTNTQRLTPVSVSGLSSLVTDISVGSYHACAVYNSTAKCWGYGASGRLGNGVTSNAYSPVSVTGLSSGVAGISVGNAHSCAMLTTGVVRCWGHNTYGQVGDGTTTEKLTPIQASGLSSGVTNLVTGNFSSCAIQNGEVKCWGYNSYGELGNGTYNTTLIPSPVTGLSSGVTSISAGVMGYNTCALLDTGGVKCWGINTYGQLLNGYDFFQKVIPTFQ